jgi:universal stress protein E
MATTKPIRRILVAVKSLEARRLPAVLKAAQLARATGAQIELFHALADPVFLDTVEASRLGVETIEQQLHGQALRKLEAVADTLRKHRIEVSVSAAWDYPAFEAIVRQAVKSGADLIVAQRYGGRHAAAGLLQLTDWELIKISPLPVLLVKSSRPYRHPHVLAAVDPSHRHAKSWQLDHSILQLGSAVAKALRGSLYAVHAYEFLPPMGGLDVAGTNVLDTLESDARAVAAERFGRVLGKTKVLQSRQLLLSGRPMDVIPEAARRSKSDLVVMGAVSRSGLKRLLIGNTAERILDDLSCDVLVVKPDNFHRRLTAAAKGARLRLTVPTTMVGFY